ncbi:MAG: glycosyltransferase family 4 protein [Clostridiales bacterium]|nr:glycosyltransferase family 4 protein [Candidatus Equinaster intestinalis]
MNVLFITLLDIKTVDDRNIYSDLMREFAKNGHNVCFVSPVERKNGKPTELLEFDGDDIHRNTKILKVKTGNIQKTNIIEKGISTVLLEGQLKNAIKKYYKNIKFDLILYSTPPITLVKPIKFVKKRDNAQTYLMLKDIFPQNAVDIGMLSYGGLKGFIYKYFRMKERKLYEISDKIGCMSRANVEYVQKNNPEISKNKLEICPNSIEPRNLSLTAEEKVKIRKKYGIPTDRKVFVYGGNLGRPQGIPFVIECLRSQINGDNYFLIVGNGTEYHKLEEFLGETKPDNMKLIEFLPTDEYDTLLAACDVGMIFLDYRFTIPNYPSRLLTYMQAGLPVLAVTDKNSDIGAFLKENEIGEYAPSSDVAQFADMVNKIAQSSYDSEKIYRVLEENYAVSKVYEIIRRSHNAKFSD